MKNNLNTIAHHYSDQKGFEGVITQYKIKEILTYTLGPKILDLGCGEGLITAALAQKNYTVVGVDGSQVKLAKAKKRLASYHVQLVKSLFEKFQPPGTFNT